MKKEVLYFATFAAGVAVGVLVSMKYFKTKYEQITEEEIESVKESLKKFKSKEPENKTKESSSDIPKDNLNDVVNKLDYTSFSKPSETTEKKEEKGDLPYIIPPAQVGEDDYLCSTYILYADGVLADELNDRVDEEELEYLIGSREVLNHIDDWNNNAVYVRNEFIKTDIEIIRSLDVYEE
jgi:hypothetical protein